MLNRLLDNWSEWVKTTTDSSMGCTSIFCQTRWIQKATYWKGDTLGVQIRNNFIMKPGQCPGVPSDRTMMHLSHFPFRRHSWIWWVLRVVIPGGCFYSTYTHVFPYGQHLSSLRCWTEFTYRKSVPAVCNVFPAHFQKTFREIYCWLGKTFPVIFSHTNYWSQPSNWRVSQK